MANRYSLVTVHGYNPLTQRPGTPYRQPVLGILHKPHCDISYSGVETPEQVSKPQQQGEFIHPKIECPTDKPNMVSVLVGETFEPTGVEVDGFRSKLTLEYDENAFEEVSDKEVKVLTYGGHVINLKYEYPFGEVCEQKLGVLAMDVSQNQCRFEVTDVYLRVGETLNYEDFIQDADVEKSISDVIYKMDVNYVVEKYGHLSLKAKNLGDVEITVIFKHGMEEYEYDDEGNFKITNLSDISYCIQSHVVHVVTAEDYAALEAEKAAEGTGVNATV